LIYLWRYFLSAVDLPSGIVFQITLFIVFWFYSVLLIVIYVVWKNFGLPTDIGIKKKISEMKDYFGPYFFVEEDEEK